MWMPQEPEPDDEEFEDAQEVEPEPESAPSPEPQIVMATSVDSELARLQRKIRSFKIENEELQRDLDECRQKLKELSSQPVIHAELEPEPEPEDLKTRGWVRFIGVTAFPGQNTDFGKLKLDNFVIDRIQDPHPRKRQGGFRTICINNGFHGYIWARDQAWFTPKLPHRVSADEYLMDITDQHPKGEVGNRKDAERLRDEVHLAPGASLDLLYQKLKELKDLDHTRKIKVEIFIEDQIDRENLIRLHPKSLNLIRASMKSKKPKKTKKRNKPKKTKKRKKPKNTKKKNKKKRKATKKEKK
jgi:hypothetical protein